MTRTRRLFGTAAVALACAFAASQLAAAPAQAAKKQRQYKPSPHGYDTSPHGYGTDTHQNGKGNQKPKTCTKIRTGKGYKTVCRRG
jgi:hypothetical protein